MNITEEHLLAAGFDRREGRRYWSCKARGFKFRVWPGGNSSEWLFEIKGRPDLHQITDMEEMLAFVAEVMFRAGEETMRQKFRELLGAGEV